MTNDDKVLVVDGKLTIGAEGKGDGNASAGWFLATNFHLYYLGEAPAEAVKQAWRRSAEEHKHRDYGDMIESIGYPRQPQTIGDALTIDIYPQGRDRKGVRNAEKAFVLHYGTSKLPASHWVDTADAYSEQTAVPAMEEIWDKFIQSRS
jgi:hypothetical protein